MGGIAAFAVLWCLMASVLIWGVVSGGRRRPPTRPSPIPEDWVLVEDLPGAGPGVEETGALLVAAALAARGVGPVPVADRRTEVVTGSGGALATRFLVRRQAISRT